MSKPTKRREYLPLSFEGSRVYRVTYSLNYANMYDVRLIAAVSPSEAVKIMKRELKRPDEYTFRVERATVLAVWE